MGIRMGIRDHMYINRTIQNAMNYSIELSDYYETAKQNYDKRALDAMLEAIANRVLLFNRNFIILNNYGLENSYNILLIVNLLIPQALKTLSLQKHSLIKIYLFTRVERKNFKYATCR